jgi:hypothetical protein
LSRKPNRPQHPSLIDNIVITIRKEESLISDLQETFDNLNRYKVKLNPTKCSFGVSAGQFLGFLVSARGKPRENPSNTNNGETSKATRRTETRRTHGGIKLIFRTIRRKSSPLLRTHEKIRWQVQVDRRGRYSFRVAKKVLSTPPVLVAPKEKEPLLLYIASTHQVVSTVLVVERSEEGKAHGVQ